MLAYISVLSEENALANNAWLFPLYVVKIFYKPSTTLLSPILTTHADGIGAGATRYKHATNTLRERKKKKEKNFHALLTEFFSPHTPIANGVLREHHAQTEERERKRENGERRVGKRGEWDKRRLNGRL